MGGEVRSYALYTLVVSGFIPPRSRHRLTCSPAGSAYPRCWLKRCWKSSAKLSAETITRQRAPSGVEGEGGGWGLLGRVYSVYNISRKYWTFKSWAPGHRHAHFSEQTASGRLDGTDPDTQLSLRNKQPPKHAPGASLPGQPTSLPPSNCRKKSWIKIAWTSLAREPAPFEPENALIEPD